MPPHQQGSTTTPGNIGPIALPTGDVLGLSLLLVILYVACDYISGIVVLLTFEFDWSSNDLPGDAYVLWELLSTLIFAGGLFAGIRWVVLVRRRADFSILGLDRFDSAYVPIAVLGALAMFFASAAVGQLYEATIGRETANPWFDATEAMGTSVQAVTVNFLTAVVAYPVVEELFFRGVVYSWLRERWTFVIAATINAAIFGLYHLLADHFFALAVGGFILAWIYDRTRSLWPCIITHAFVNAFVTVLYYLYL